MEKPIDFEDEARKDWESRVHQAGNKIDEDDDYFDSDDTEGDDEEE